MESTKKSTQDDEFAKFDSSVKRIFIPLKKFQFFHKASEPGNINPVFIERKIIYSKLKNWISGNNSSGGSYLVTGYRGAGKSSFVSKVVNDIISESSTSTTVSSIILFIATQILLFLFLVKKEMPNTICTLTGLVWISLLIYNLFLIPKKKGKNAMVIDFLPTLVGIVLIALYIIWKWNIVDEANSFVIGLVLFFIATAAIFWAILIEDVLSLKKIFSLRLLHIKINLSHETLMERDILCLIAVSLRNEYVKYTQSFERNISRYASKVIINIFIANLLWTIYKTLTGLTEIKDVWKWFKPIYELSVNLYKDHSPLIDLIVFFILLFIANTIRIAISIWITKHIQIPLASNRIAIQQLENLIERTEAKVSTNEGGVPITNKWIQINFSGKKSKSYGMATEREIEQELIEILNRISKNRIYPIRVVIVLDELDKTDPVNEAIENIKEETLPEFEKSSVIHSGGTTSRERKTNVLSIIANMKFFLSSSDAYFIFIAGRELYDAYLADISDRDFTLSSIFNGVINVDSFLTSSRNMNSTSSMAEQYICHYLLDDTATEYTLKEYYKNEKKKLNNGTDKEELKKLEAKIDFLYRFSLYLSYVSNGSPKKIGLFFEKYVREESYVTEYKHMNETKEENKAKKEADYYLTFGVYSQQKINFIYYLVYPVMQAIINRSNAYGDKLLVSATFIVSHIYKLYNSGFSWRNLEQTPELLETTRTPELREYIISIIDFLKRTHIENIICGLYQYKFPLKIAEEIAYQSKLSDEISALFNFSLDETLHIKRYYTRLLKTYSDPVSTKTPNGRYIVANIHHILGDIYMNEENYLKAIFEFQTSAAILQDFIPHTNKKDHWFYYLYLVHTLLKLGLANEKRHTNHSALLIYGKISELLLKIKKENGSITIFSTKLKVQSEEYNSFFTNLRMLYQPLVARLYVLEKTGIKGIEITDIVKTISLFNQLHQPRKKGTQGLLEADFYKKIGEITFYKNYKRFYLKKRKSSNYCRECKSDKAPYCNIACLFYKKSIHILLEEYIDKSKPLFSQLFLNIASNSTDFNRKIILESNEEYLRLLGNVIESRGTVLFSCSKGEALSMKMCRSFLIFVEKQRNIVQEKKGEEEGVELKVFSKWLETRPKVSNLDQALLYYWCAATCYNHSDDLNSAVRCYKQILHIIHSSVYLFPPSPSEGDMDLLKLIEENILNRALISLYSHYENINIVEIQDAKWRYDKAMFEHISLNRLSLVPDMEELFYVYYSIILQFNFPLNKFKEIYSSDLFNSSRNVGGVSVMVHNLRLKADMNNKLLFKLLENKKYLSEKKLKSYEDIFNDPDLPILFFEMLNKFSEPEAENKNHDITKKIFGLPAGSNNFFKVLDFLVIDSLFCLTQILEVIIPLKATTLFTNYYIANTYEQLLHINYIAEFIYYLYSYMDEEKPGELQHPLDNRLTQFINTRRKTFKEEETKFSFSDLNNLSKALLQIKASETTDKEGKKGLAVDFYKKIEEKIKRSNVNYTVSVYLAESAIRYYNRAEQIHQEGEAYKEMMRNLHLLDDDLNNNTCQFLLAQERYFLNSEMIRERSDKLKRLFPKSTLYLMESYLKYAHEST